MPLITTNREAAVELGTTRARCYGCELLPSAPQYDAQCHAHCPECAETYCAPVVHVNGDAIASWIAAGHKHHAEIRDRIELQAAADMIVSAALADSFERHAASESEAAE